MDYSNRYNNPNPKLSAKILSKLTFSWLVPLFWYGRTHDLATKDLYDVLPENESEYVSRMLERSWQEEVEKAEKRKCKPSLFKAVAKTCQWPTIFHGVLFFIAHVILRLLIPMTIDHYTKFFDRKTLMWDGIGSVTVVVLSLSIMSLIFIHSTFKLRELGMRMKIACSCLIYQKMMKLSCTAMSQIDEGHIINLLSNEVIKWEQFFVFVHFAWMAPIYLLLVAYIMRENVETASIVGISVFLIQTLPVQGVFNKIIYDLRLKATMATDRRILLIKEIISGIRMIKMYTWEKPFEKFVLSSRKREIKWLKLLSYTNGVSQATDTVISRNSLFVTILVYFFIEGKLMLSENIFNVWRYFISLQIMITVYLPNAVLRISETRVAVKRIETFLLLKEMKSTTPCCPKNSIDHNLSVLIQRVSASWETQSSTNVLSDISIKMHYKQLYVVVGPTGAGKSSLLQLILGELQPKAGTFSVHGKVSYSSQMPWLFCGSVKNNIIFGEPYDESRYRDVINACALIEDFNQLPYGDKTLVGDGGVLLSGGQRARISLARAVYKRADIYLLDDCLSAVDVLVGKTLYEKCFKGFLQKKTCILVTHNTQYTDHKDEIILMDKGMIKYEGTFANLKNDDCYSQYLAVKINLSKVMKTMYNSKNHETERYTDEYLSTNFEGKEDEESSETENLTKRSNELKEIDELKGRGNVSAIVYWKYFKSGGSYWKFFVIAFIALLTQLLLSLADLWVSHISKMNTSNFSVFTNEINATSAEIFTENNNEKYVALYVFGFLVIGSTISTFARNLLFLGACVNASKTIHNSMLIRLLRAPTSFFDVNNAGCIINRFSRDIGSVDNQLAELLLWIFSTIVLVIAMFLQFSVVEWRIIFPTGFVILIFIIVQYNYQATAADVGRLEGVAKGPVFSHVSSSFTGLLTIRSRQLEKLVYEQFINLQNNHTSAYYLVQAGTALSNFWIEYLGIAFTAFISYGLLFTNIDSNTVNFLYIQTTSLLDLIGDITRMFPEILSKMVHLERMLQFTEVEQESPSKSQIVKKSFNSWPVHGCIQINNLHLKYLRATKPVLKNLNFSIACGQKIGIVGRTGAGKSSLIAALFRLVDFDGCISIDNVNIKELSVLDLRSKISIVPQDCILFTVSLRDNLDPNSEYSDETIWSALRDVGLGQMYNLLNVPLDKKQLSTGQIQLLSLARVIIRNNKILIFDESTANVDHETDIIVQNTIKNKFKDSTVIFIAHRLTTVIDCDKILVMDNGQLLEFDHPYVLLQKKGGFFQSMVFLSNNDAYESLKQIA